MRAVLIDMEVHESWRPLFERHAADVERAVRASEAHSALDPEFPLVFPPRDVWFRAFRMPVSAVRAVILGQDPYHGPGQAMGLAFSVPRDQPIPPSLANVFREIRDSHPERSFRFEHGDLSRWADDEGVFLLNSALTVKRGKPGSFLDEWQAFTDAVIRYVAETNPDAVFLLLGAFAKKKAALVGDDRRVFAAAHPSPLSANRGGFFGSGVFRRVGIDWQN